MAADRKQGRVVALGGMLAALSTVILWLGGMLPGYAIPTAAVAGLVCAVAVIKGGIGLGAAVFPVSACLALLILPQKSPAIWYLVFFGHYPLIKSLTERLKSRIMEWGLKAAAYTAAFLILKFLFSELFAGLLPMVPDLLLFVLGLGVFVLYDIGFSRLIGLYLRRIDRNSGRRV